MGAPSYLPTVDLLPDAPRARAPAREGVSFTVALAAYRQARDRSQAASQEWDAACDRLQELGGRTEQPEALAFHDDDHALRLPGAADWHGGRFFYGRGAIANLRDVPRVRRVERSRPVTVAEGFRQDEVDAGCTITQAVREPWPEAQARADEIVAAWDWWAVENERREQQSGYRAAVTIDAERSAERRAAAFALAQVPASNKEEICTKLVLLLEASGQDVASLRAELLDQSGTDEVLLTASVMLDAMQLFLGLGAAA